MEKLDQSNSWNGRGRDTGPTLDDVLDVLFDARKWIAGVTAACVVLGMAAALYLAKYHSDGFLQFGGAIPWSVEKDRDGKSSTGIMLADYKRYAASFNTSERFADYVQQNKMEEIPGVAALSRQFAARDGISRLVEPVYPYTKLDAKELMDQPKDAINNVIGLRINYGAASPQEAQSMVGLLGRYTMDSIIYMIYWDNLRFKRADLAARITQLDNDIIQSNEKLEEYRRKGVTLKQIVAHYPDGGSQSGRQVVTITEENSRYLSPSTHLMSTEVQTLAASEDILRYQREQQKFRLLSEYYDKAKDLLAANKSGEAVLRGLDGVKEQVFKAKNMKDEVVREVYNMISIDNQSSVNVYLEKTRFIAGPTLPQNRATKLSMVLMLSLLVGLFLSSTFTLLRKWRSKRR